MKTILCALLLAAAPGPVQSQRTFAYGERRGALLDLYSPAGRGPFAAILAVHGGGWSGGARSDAAGFCREMAESGFKCAALDYRLAPATRFPAQLDDIEAAAAFLTENTANFGLIPGALFLAGESAGGHLVSYAGAEHSGKTPIAGVISFSAPEDLLALSEPGRALGIVPPEVHELLGASAWDVPGIEAMRKGSPAAAIRPGAPPFLLLHGDADRLVPAAQASAFCAALNRNGSRCLVHLVHGARHGLWNEDQIDAWKNQWVPVVSDWIGTELTNRGYHRMGTGLH